MNTQAVIQELEEQRNIAFSRCGQMASIIADLQEKIKSLEPNQKASANVEPIRSKTKQEASNGQSGAKSNDSPIQGN